MEPDRAPPPSRGEVAAAPTSTEEPRGIPAETANAERPPDPEAELQAAATHPVELPPCHGVPGPYLGELPATDLQPRPPCVSEPPREPPVRGQCLMHNWQEERATNCLDRVPRPEYGSEGFFHRFGHPGLLTLDFLAGTPTTTTMKDSFPLPVKTGLPVRGKREAMMEHLLYQKHSMNLLARDASPPSEPMESLSITHRDYRQEGFHPEPLPPASPTTTGWNNPRRSGLNMPSRCRAPPASGRATPLSGSVQCSPALARNASTSHSCTAQKTSPSLEDFLATPWASGKAPSLWGWRGVQRPFLKGWITPVKFPQELEAQPAEGFPGGFLVVLPPQKQRGLDRPFPVLSLAKGRRGMFSPPSFYSAKTACLVPAFAAKGENEQQGWLSQLSRGRGIEWGQEPQLGRASAAG